MVLPTRDYPTEISRNRKRSSIQSAIVLGTTGAIASSMSPYSETARRRVLEQVIESGEFQHGGVGIGAAHNHPDTVPHSASRPSSNRQSRAHAEYGAVTFRGGVPGRTRRKRVAPADRSRLRSGYSLLPSGSRGHVILRVVAVVDKPLEDLVAEERALPSSGSAVGGDDLFPGPGTDYLIRGVQSAASCLASMSAGTSGYQRS